MYSCRILSSNRLHDPILLDHNQPKFVGRGPLTKIKDPRLSRNHIELIADCRLGYLTVKLIGPNRCRAGDEVLTQNKSVRLRHGQTIHLLENLYPCTVDFSPVPSYTEPSGAEMVGKQTTLNHFLKRKTCDEDSSTDTPNDAKKIKTGSSWEEIDGGKLIVYSSENVEPRAKIAAFDLDGTIITTKSGKVFPSNCQDWKLNLSQVPGKLKQLLEDGFKVVFITNQAGLGSGKVNSGQFRQKLCDISSKLNIPIQVFISPGSGIYRKPATGMWNYLVNHANGNIPVDISASFYCGDAAGREAKWAPGKKKDHSSVDRLLAVNVGLKFYTPEEYFLGQRPVPFKEPEFDPHSVDASGSLLDPPDCPLFVKEQEVILLVGYPGSGKSHFAAEHALQSNYAVINRDSLGSWQKCAAATEKLLDEGRSVLIDNTNPDKESRSRFVQLASARRLPCRCFVMNTTLVHARHNNKFRELTDEKHAPISRMIFNVYKSKYQEPSLENEKFSQVVRVNFRPNFKSEDDERLYKTYLLED